MTQTWENFEVQLGMSLSTQDWAIALAISIVTEFAVLVSVRQLTKPE